MEHVLLHLPHDTANLLLLITNLKAIRWQWIHAVGTVIGG